MRIEWNPRLVGTGIERYAPTYTNSGQEDESEGKLVERKSERALPLGDASGGHGS